MDTIDLGEEENLNKIMPTDDETSTEIEKCVKIHVNEQGLGSAPPISVPGLFRKTLYEFGEKPALSFKGLDGDWNTITYREYHRKVEHVGKALIKLGLEEHRTVGVIAFNCPEWFYTELATIHARGVISGIYTTNSPEAVYHSLHASSANIVVVDDSKQMEKIRVIRHRLPLLKAAIQINGPFEPFVNGENGYYKWSDVETMNVADVEEEYRRRLNSVLINECCMLIFTSGTVGFPKAVMLSHDNVTWGAASVAGTFVDVEKGNERIVSYLPLSHIAAQIMDIFIPLVLGGCVYFADRNALKGTLTQTLTTARPTRFFGVPRVYEKIDEKLSSLGRKEKMLKKIVLDWAKRTALKHNLNIMKGEAVETWQYKIANLVVLEKIKTAIGLNYCKIFLIGGAPTSVDTKKFFMSLDINLTDIFGMSECLVQTSCAPFAPNFNTVGTVLEGVQGDILNPDEKGNGEVLIKGRNRFMGYLNEPEKTKETIDENGWVHSGDIGHFDENGYLYITGRQKEIIITAGGENIPPNHVEQLVKNELPVVSNALLVGDKKKFLTMLITLKTEMDPDTGAPKDQLLPDTIDWLRSLELNYNLLSEIIEAGPCPVVLQAIEEGIKRANKNAISNAQKVQKFTLLPHDFSLFTGELGPTLKLKRNVVLKMYADVIDNMYK